MNWQEIEIFKGVDLHDSFIMSWDYGKNNLVFEIEASIWPESKYYEKPKKDEYTCYKPAQLIFSNVNEVNDLLNMDQVTPSTDATGEKDYGYIENLQIEKGIYLIEGEFGSVSITGGELSFEIKT